MPIRKKRSTTQQARRLSSKSVQAISVVPVTPATTTNTPFSLDVFLTFIQNNFVILFLFILLFVGGFFFGSLWTENKVAKSGRLGTTSAPNAALAAPPAAPAGPTVEQLKSVAEVTDTDHVLGDPKKAQVVLFEYSDLNCHFCQQFHPTMLAIREKYGDQVAWVYRHHPILGSQTEAEAAECAAKLGGESAFWDFVADYFTTVAGTPDTGSKDALLARAQSLGISQSAFSTCLDSGEMTQVVTTMSSGAQAIGLTSTPSTVVWGVNGEAQLINGAQPLEQVTAIVERYL